MTEQTALTSASRDGLVLIGDSTLGDWLFSFLQEAARCAEPQVEMREAGPQQPCDDIGRPEGARRIIVVRHPYTALAEAIAQQRLPIVAVIDDPVDMVRHTKAVHGCTLVQALHAQTSCASAHYLLVDNDRGMLVRRGTERPARDIAGAVLTHLGFSLSPGTADAALDHFCGPAVWTLERALQERVSSYVPLNQSSLEISADEASVVRQVLSPLVLGALTRDIGSIVWPHQTFFFGDNPDKPVPRVVEITGHPRILYFGPYFHLPPGFWQVRFIVAFSNESVGMPFSLSILHADQHLITVAFQPTERGAFEGTFTMHHDRPHDHLQINLKNEEGSIEGHIALGQISFTRLSG